MALGSGEPLAQSERQRSHTNHMSVNRKTWHAKSIPKHHIRGFAPHAWQTCQRVHILRHFAIEPFAQCVRKSDDILCFRMMKSDGMNDAFHMFGIGARKCVWSRISGVTIFTRLSVVCALSTVATSNSKGFEKFSAHFGCGISSHNTAYS